MRYILLLFVLCLMSSCLEDIDLDHITQKKLVVEAKVPLEEKAWVKLTETISKTASNNFPGVENAIVRLSDDQGNEEELNYVGNGLYEADTLIGQLGTRYFLNIEHERLAITGSSLMPAMIVPVDSLWYDERYDSENFFQGTFITARVITPPGAITYGLLRLFINGELTETDYFIKNADEVNEFTLRVNQIFGLDEEIKAIFYHLEPQVYDYLKTIYELDDSSGLTLSPVAPPNNPVVNLEGETLGYFSAMAESQKILVIE